MKIFKVGKKDDGERLDIFLSKKIKKSRSKIQKMIENEIFFINNIPPSKSGEKIKTGDRIRYDENFREKKEKKEILDESKEKLDEISIIHDEKDFLVVYKPSGLLVHPTEAEEPYTLSNWLISKYPKLKEVGESPKRPGIVHRLDKDASGLLVVAKNQKMFDSLKEQFKKRRVEKKYIVLVHGVIEADSGKIDFLIGRTDKGMMASRPKLDKTKLKNVGLEQKGKKALTFFKVLKRFSRYSLLEVEIKTGRTHQIRVHMKAYGHPVVGDKLYYNKKIKLEKDRKLGRLFLHASDLCFYDLKGTKQCFHCEMSKKLELFLSKLN
ncbi:MAG: RluA family pseudouridine synthase [Candidatus Magasanikbacteria bacterium]|nr:RluA family pseudouridine synthase [Candidatus Magasanikbacteria bacterium]